VLGGNARAAVGRFWAPVVARLARAGVTADMVTVTGTLGAIAGAVLLIARGELFWGAVTVTVFVLLDMLDGALARARGGGSAVRRGARLHLRPRRRRRVFGALVWWFTGAGDDRLLALLALLGLVLGRADQLHQGARRGRGHPLRRRAGGADRAADPGAHRHRPDRLGIPYASTSVCGCCSSAARSPSAAGGRRPPRRQGRPLSTPAAAP
jgi:CDP-diacylglycerol--glycerol-3-phosphate 3-phosphatidyltransferase